MKYEFAICGAGISGAIAFFHISKFASCILIEKKQLSKPYNTARIFSRHNYSWLTDLPLEDTSIFPRELWKTIYSSRYREAQIDGHEFNLSLGKIANEYNLIK